MIDKNKEYNLESKDDFQSIMLEILRPLKKHYSEGCAQLYLGDTFAHYDINATYMEAVSRPLWALVPFWAGGGMEAVSAGEPSFLEIYRKALVNGTNPDHPEYWGECGSFDQRFVEMAAISYGIMFAPKAVWDPLSESEKRNLSNYLNKINEHPLPVCNWILFAVLVNTAMKKAGMPYDEKMLNKYLDGLETFYIGDGWYKDGDSNQKDYYISFAIHFYCLIYAIQMEDCDPERCKLYKERAMEFAKTFIYWFDEDGDAIPFGRSLTYRFSQVSFFSVCLLAGLEPFPVPVMKGLIARHLKSWLKRPIFDRDGILTIGYGYPNLVMSERYNAPGSPYWGMKVFAFLLLPDNHPFWSVKAAEYPENIIARKVCPIPAADMLVYHHGNHATAFVPGVYSRWGHGHIVEKYSKFAYDTKFSINVARSQYELDENAPNNMLAFFINGFVYVRRQCIKHEITENGVYSVWSPHEGITVETLITPTEAGYVSKHKITSTIECEAYEFGFPIRRDDFEAMDNTYENSDDNCLVTNRNSWCRVSGGKGHYIFADPDTNLLYQRTAIPGIEIAIKKGEQNISVDVTAGWN